MDACFAYEDVLRKHGHLAGGEAFQSARNATTLRWQNGQVSSTDGPYAETKEQLGSILVLEATDLHHAIQLMSKHPGVKAGAVERRPALDDGNGRKSGKDVERHARTAHGSSLRRLCPLSRQGARGLSCVRRLSGGNW